MSFSMIRANISSGKYQAWNDLQDDLELMCHNALTYNPPGSVFYKEATHMDQVQTAAVCGGDSGLHGLLWVVQRVESSVCEKQLCGRDGESCQ